MLRLKAKRCWKLVRKSNEGSSVTWAGWRGSCLGQNWMGSRVSLRGPGECEAKPTSRGCETGSPEPWLLEAAASEERWGPVCPPQTHPMFETTNSSGWILEKGARIVMKETQEGNFSFRGLFKLHVVKVSIVDFIEQSSKAFWEYDDSFFDKLPESQKDWKTCPSSLRFKIRGLSFPKQDLLPRCTAWQGTVEYGEHLDLKVSLVIWTWSAVLLVHNPRQLSHWSQCCHSKGGHVTSMCRLLSSILTSPRGPHPTFLF